MSDTVKMSKPIWLSKTNMGVLVAVASFVLGYFGLGTDWLIDLAAAFDITPWALSASMMALLNVVMKALTWAWFKWVVKAS